MATISNTNTTGHGRNGPYLMKFTTKYDYKINIS